MTQSPPNTNTSVSHATSRVMAAISGTLSTRGSTTRRAPKVLT